MSNNIKKEIEKIQIPPNLQERTKLGVDQAFRERRGRKGFGLLNYRNKRMLAASILGFLLISSVFFHTEVLAAVKKALQFIPGIGIVHEEESPQDRYFLQKPVTTQIGEGTLTITGFMVDEEMTVITVSAENVNRFGNVKVINEQKKEYEIESSGMAWTTGEWTSSYWYQGELDLQGEVELVFNSEVIIPVMLEQAKTYGSYTDMGEVAIRNGVEIIAIPQRVDEKVRISLVSEHPEEYWISDYGVHGIHMRDDKKLFIVDEKGTKYGLEVIKGISAPADEFYFNLSDESKEKYMVTIPEIDVEYHDEAKITLNIPEKESDLEQTFEIAGFPVKITRIKRLDGNRIGLYIDVNLDESVPKSLYNFHIKSMGHMAKVNEQTGELEYLEFTLENPNSKRVKLGFDRPKVIIKGPWTFEIPTEKYLLNIK